MQYNLLRRLKLLEEKTLIYVNDDYSKHAQVDNRLLEDVIDTIRYLIRHKKKKKIESLWKQIFLRRLQRTLTRAEDICEYFLNDGDDDGDGADEDINLRKFLLQVLWQQYNDECRYVLHGRMPMSNSHIRLTYLQVQKLESKLKHRKEYFARIHGRHKTLSELCKKHYLFLNEYLDKCVSFHSKYSIRLSIEVEDVRQFMRQISEENSAFSSFNLSKFEHDIEMPLRFACGTMTDYDISSKLNDEKKGTSFFLPSARDHSLERGILFKNILSILQSYRWSIILGDPCSGKTTLLRWLTLEYARFFQQGAIDHFLLTGQNDWEILANQIPLTNCSIISVARIPILIRIEEFVTWLDSHINGSLLDYIGQHTWHGQRYSESNHSKILHEFIHHGHAIILLDGLDEISNYEKRKRVVNLIEIFLDKHVQSSSFISVMDDKTIVENWNGSLEDYPEFLLERNQIIITSRVLGYNIVPFQSNLIAHFHLQPMKKIEVELFIRHWLTNVDNVLINYISSENYLRVNEKRLNEIREKLCQKVLNLTTRSNLLSHPILLSLALSSLICDDVDKINFKSHIIIYDLIKKTIINNCISSRKIKLNSRTIERILRSLAAYIYEYCPSGWIDTYDLMRIVSISLRISPQDTHEFYISNNELNTQVKKFVDLLSSNSVGFAMAQGLDAYGFLHRSFEEYFVALSIVDPLTSGNVLSVTNIVDRLFTCLWKTEHHKPVTFAIGWLDLHLSVDNMEQFCSELLNKKVALMPIGCFLLIDALRPLHYIRSSSIVVRILGCLFRSTNLDHISKEYLRRALNSLPMEIAGSLFENFLHENSIPIGQLCEFIVYCMEPIVNKKKWILPLWLTNTTINYIINWDTNDVYVHTIIDWILRHIELPPYNNDFNILQTFLISNRIPIGKVHPLILSVIVVLCGGMIKEEDSIRFDLKEMHQLTPLAPLLIECLENMNDVNQNISVITHKCEMIIFETPKDDISRRTQDILLTLIILRGVTPSYIFEHFYHYKALPLVFYRLKLVLYHLRQVYTIQNIGFRNHPPLFSNVNTLLNEISTEYNADALTIAVIYACEHLASSNILSWNNIPSIVSCNRINTSTEDNTICSLKYLRLLLTSSVRNKRAIGSLWKYREHPLFLISFVPASLQPIFERFVLRQRMNLNTSEWNYICEVVLLAEVLLFIDEQDISMFQLSSFLNIIQDDVKKNQLESYATAIVQTLKSTRFEYNSENNEILVPTAVDLVFVNHIIEQEFERICKTTSSSIKQQRLSVDLQLFSATLSIIRMCTFINDKKDIFEKVIPVVLTIEDYVLRVLCLCHIRQIVRKWSDRMIYNALQRALIETELAQLSFDLPFLIKSIILISCIEEGEKIHPLLNRLLDHVCKYLHNAPIDEEDAKDQENVFQALRTIVELEIELPTSFKTRSNLSSILELNSPTLHSFLFLTNESFLNRFDNIFLSQLYITELTIDTNTLMTIVPFSDQRILTVKTLQSTGKLFEHWNWSQATKKFPHHLSLSINMYLNSVPNQNTEQFVSLDGLIVYKDIEMRDQSMIENWLSHYNDNDTNGRSQFALLAIGLLLRKNYESLSSPIIELIFSIIEKSYFHPLDNIRCQARAAFRSWYDNNTYITCKKWNPSMWQILRKIWLHSPTFMNICVELVDDINVLIGLESNRLRAIEDDDEKFSFFCLIGCYSKEAFSCVVKYMQTQLNSDLILNDEYFAMLIVHLAEIDTDRDSEWYTEHFIEMLKTIVYEKHALPLLQRAALFALTFHEKGRTLLKNIFYISQHNVENNFHTIRDTEQSPFPNNIFSLGLWTLVDIPEEYCSLDASFFRSIGELYSSDIVSENAMACYHWMSWKDKKFEESISDTEHRLNVNAHFLYTIVKTKMHHTIERENGSDWNMLFIELLRNHWNNLADCFINDLLSSLSICSRTMNRVNRQADFLYVASELIEFEVKSFCESVRKNIHGEDVFKQALFRAWKKGTIQQRRWCIQIYSAFEIVTVDWIFMVFTDFADLCEDYEGLFIPLEKAENRDAIESIFPYLKSTSIGKRNFAATLLMHLAIYNEISCSEVYKLLEDVLKDPSSSRLFYNKKEERNKPMTEQIQCLLLKITCLSIDLDRKSLSILLPEKVIADFYECTEASHYSLQHLK